MIDLFVYGTLKSDGTLHQAISDGKFLGEYVTKANGFVMTSAGGGSFPFVYYTDRKNPYKIKGELYNVTEDIKKRCNFIECGAGYTFREIDQNVFGYIYPEKIGTPSNSIRVNEDEKYFEWLNNVEEPTQGN